MVPKQTAATSAKKRGKAPFSEIQKAETAVVKCHKAMKEAEAEFKLQVGVTKKTGKAKATELESIGQRRLKLSKKLDSVMLRKNSLNRDMKEASQSGVSDTKLKRLHKEKRELADQEGQIREKLFRMPPLGATQREWDALPDTHPLKSQRLGRPRLSVEQNLARKTAAYNEALRHLRDIEKSPRTIGAILNDPLYQNASKSGRPSLDPLGLMDRNLVRTNKKIEELEAQITSESTAGGSKLEAYSEKHAALVREKGEIVSRIAQLESELVTPQKEEREIKKLRDDAYQARSIIKHRDEYAAKDVKQAERDLEATEALIQEKLEFLETLSKERRGPGRAQTIAGAADKGLREGVRDIKTEHAKTKDIIAELEKQLDDTHIAEFIRERHAEGIEQAIQIFSEIRKEAEQYAYGKKKLPAGASSSH